MSFVNRKLFLSLLLLIIAAFLVNCATASKPADNSKVTPDSKTSTTTEKKPTTEPTKATETTDVASTGDKIGVPECDEYIEKYEACLRSKVPEQARAMMENSFEQTRKTWKSSATNPQAKSALATGCKQAMETAKQSMSAYGCAF